jgi:hypothetical protein
MTKKTFPIAGTLLLGALSVFQAGIPVHAAVVLQGQYEAFAGATRRRAWHQLYCCVG